MSGEWTLGEGHFLAASVAPGDLPESVMRALRRLGASPAVLADGVALLRTTVGDSASPVAQVDATSGAILDPTALPSVTGDELADWVATILPPAGRAVVESTATGPRVRVATDSRAICELYEAHGPGWALASTSPLLLAAATAASVDERAVVLYSQLGHFLADDTPWLGVRRLAPGEILTLQAGAVTSDTVGAAGRSITLSDATRLVVEAVAGEAVELELSGGLDSRLILAALTNSGAEFTRGFTIGSPGEADREVAIELAHHLGLPHEIVDPAAMADDPADALVRLACGAGADRGWVANPIDAAPLHWAEGRRGVLRGLSGQNGEIARGFYYRGPHRCAPTGRRVALLTRWRLLANAAIDVSTFRPDIGASVHHTVVDAVGEWLDDSSLSRFLESTDDFYLRHRMTRWVGPAYAAAARRHPVVSPFFSAGFIDAAGRLTVQERRHSTAVARAVVELDRDLADRPLAGGPPPTRLAAGSRSAALLGLTAQGRKAVRKVTQRLGREPVRPSGTGVVTAALAARVDELIELVGDDPLLSVAGLIEVRERPDARDLSFLLSLAAWRNPDERALAESLGVSGSVAQADDMSELP